MTIKELEDFKDFINNISVMKIKEIDLINELRDFKLFLEDYIKIFSTKKTLIIK